MCTLTGVVLCTSMPTKELSYNSMVPTLTQTPVEQQAKVVQVQEQGLLSQQYQPFLHFLHLLLTINTIKQYQFQCKQELCMHLISMHYGW